MKTRFTLSSLFLLIAALLAFGSMAIAQDEKVLVIGHAESTDSLDPARGYTQTTGFILKAAYQTLVTFPDDSASELLPELATDWTISEDGLTYTFTIAEGKNFASGNPITPADVVFSFNRLINLNGSPSFLANNIASVAEGEGNTVVVTLSAADPSFLSLLPNSAFSVIDSAVVLENGGTDAIDTDAGEAYLNGTSAGSGPYILESWDPQVQTNLVRNPNFNGDAPYFDRVIVVNIPEPATQKASLEAGDIDLALDLTSDQIVGLEGNANISIARGPANIIHFLLMNNDPEIGGVVADPKVQQAIRLALDYDGYKELWGGVQPGSNLAVGLLGAYEEDKAVKRDLDAARALLAEAGYPDGFEITLSYPDLSFQGVNMNTNAQKIQADLAEIGITVNLNVGELQVALEDYRNGVQGFGYWFWGPDKLDSSDLLSFVPGGKVASERAKWDLEDVPAEIQDLIAQAQTVSDPDERVAIYGQLQDFLQQNGSFAPFNQPDIQTAFRADLQGYVWHPQWLIDVALLSRAE